MLYFVIYALIFAIMLVSAFSSFDCRFKCVEPSNRRKNEVQGLAEQEELQRKPNRLNSGDPRQNLANQKVHQNAVRKALRPSQAGATTGFPWGPPRPVVEGARPCAMGGTTVRPLLSPILPFFFAAFRFLVRFAGFAV